MLCFAKPLSFVIFLALTVIFALLYLLISTESEYALLVIQETELEEKSSKQRKKNANLPLNSNVRILVSPPSSSAPPSTIIGGGSIKDSNRHGSTSASVNPSFNSKQSTNSPVLTDELSKPTSFSNHSDRASSTQKATIVKNNSHQESLDRNQRKDTKPPVALGCYHVPLIDQFERAGSDARMTPEICSSRCSRHSLRFFGLEPNGKCWCGQEAPLGENKVDLSECPTPCPGDSSQSCGGKAWRSSVYENINDLPERITIYVAPAKRTSSLYLSGRLEKYYSDKYVYVQKSFNYGVTRTDEVFYKEVCEDNPGKKIFVQIAGAVKYILTHFPDNSILVLTGDEIGNWGLSEQQNQKYFGPHGPKEPFKTNTSSPYGEIILPQTVKPFFKQYYNHQQFAAFGRDVRFIPLGSRVEFDSIHPDKIIAAPQRQYVYSYMASITDAARKQVYELLLNDTIIPKEKRFIHVSQSWHGSANNEEYVAPSEYQRVMLNSIFTIAPKGHSVEQFRIYEALETGSIPVMALEEGYLKLHLPPEYFDSPMLFIDTWEDCVSEMMSLVNDPDALLKRQQDLLVWYEEYMRSKVREMEQVLEERPDGSFCADFKKTLGKE